MQLNELKKCRVQTTCHGRWAAWTYRQGVGGSISRSQFNLTDYSCCTFRNRKFIEWWTKLSPIARGPHNWRNDDLLTNICRSILWLDHDDILCIVVYCTYPSMILVTARNLSNGFQKVISDWKRYGGRDISRFRIHYKIFCIVTFFLRKKKLI